LPATPPSDSEAASPDRPYLRQLALQCAAAFAVLSMAWPYYGLRAEALPWPQTALAIGGVALIVAAVTRQPWWWWVIHALFAPLAWCISGLNIDPGWFLLAFVVILLVYRGALSGQVPVYLSNRDTANALAGLLPEQAGARFLDLGAGIGSVLCPLARARPDAQFTGIENAPLVWLTGYLRTRGMPACVWCWGDMWRADLAGYDVVYAFLSPAPMPALWAKAKREMRPGSLLVSNSFAVPEVGPERIIELDDPRQTVLYCYRL
jgi:hypothetical protein